MIRRLQISTTQHPRDGGLSKPRRPRSGTPCAANCCSRAAGPPSAPLVRAIVSSPPLWLQQILAGRRGWAHREERLTAHRPRKTTWSSPQSPLYLPHRTSGRASTLHELGSRHKPASDPSSGQGGGATCPAPHQLGHLVAPRGAGTGGGRCTTHAQVLFNPAEELHQAVSGGRPPTARCRYPLPSNTLFRDVASALILSLCIEYIINFLTNSYPFLTYS